MTLDYEVQHYPPGQVCVLVHPIKHLLTNQNFHLDARNQAEVKKWYPRASAIGGSTVHNALIHLRPHDYDLDLLATRFQDSSWSVSRKSSTNFVT